jgi:hypothetical protein
VRAFPYGDCDLHAVARRRNCWRPVRPVKVAEDLFEVAEHLPEGESWAFAPGSRVRCRNHVFTTGGSGLTAFAYAVEGNPYYQLMKRHEGEIFRVVFANGEEAVVRVLHVDGQYEDFVYDLLSTNLDREANHARKGAAYASKFADLVSARLGE